MLPSLSAPVAIELMPGLKVAAEDYFTLYARVYGLGCVDQMVLMTTDAPAAAYGLTRAIYRQVHDGLPVYGAEVTLTLRDKRVVSAFGHAVPGLITPRFAVDSRTSSALAIRAVGDALSSQRRPAPTDLRATTQTVLLPDIGGAAWQRQGAVASAFRPGYRVQVQSTGEPIHAEVRIAAHDGSVLMLDFGLRSTTWSPRTRRAGT